MDDGLIISNHLECLQGAFDALTGLFDLVGIFKNVGKTVGMLFGAFITVGTQLDEVYDHRMKGGVLAYLDNQKQQVHIP